MGKCAIIRFAACAAVTVAAGATLSAVELTHRWSFNGDYSDSVGGVASSMRPDVGAALREGGRESCHNGAHAPLPPRSTRRRAHMGPYRVRRMRHLGTRGEQEVSDSH